MSLTDQQNRIIEDNARDLLTRNAAFRSMPAGDQGDILQNTASVMGLLAQQPIDGLDVYSQVLAEGDPPASVRASDEFRAEGVTAGVRAAGQLLREVDFPKFVSELIKGVFHSVVEASMDQMKAYGELVQSVAMSLNEFRDQNVSQNQARDHLVSKYPSLMKINVVEGEPQVMPQDGAMFAELPDFANDFGLEEEVTDLDEETIEQVLVPAARDELAARRQKLLSTLVLMGINRIIVTDGRINAKVKFQFGASDSLQRVSRAVDYENVGTRHFRQGSGQPAYDSSGRLVVSGKGNRYATDSYQEVDLPVIRVTDHSQARTDAELTTAGNLTGEVRLNFRSETLPLERLVDNDQLLRLNEAQQGPGHGVPRGAPGQQVPATAPGSPAAPPAGTAPA